MSFFIFFFSFSYIFLQPPQGNEEKREKND